MIFYFKGVKTSYLFLFYYVIETLYRHEVPKSDSNFNLK